MQSGWREQETRNGRNTKAVAGEGGRKRKGSDDKYRQGENKEKRSLEEGRCLEIYDLLLLGLYQCFVLGKEERKGSEYSSR